MAIKDYLNNDNYLNRYDKIEQLNQKYNFVVTTIKDDKQKIEGKLSNVAIALKDNISTKDVKTTASCGILQNYVPIYDATIVTKLKQAGAKLICKTSLDALAMGGTNLTAFTGPCLNPYDTSRISGGSSGGSAVSVACGLVDVAIGSDTGDSVRKPASYCGVIGVKPSYGRISRYGIIPYASSLDNVGYFTGNVHDAALMLEVLAGRDDQDMTSSNLPVEQYSALLNSDVQGKKVLVFKNVIDVIDNKDILESFNKVIAGLKAKGAYVEEVSFNQELLDCILPVYYIIANCEAIANHSNLTGINFGNTVDGESVEDIVIQTRTKHFNEHLKARFVIGSFGLAKENQDKYFRKAQKIRRLIVEEVNSKLSKADILIAPAAVDIAPFVEKANNNELESSKIFADNHLIIGNFAGLPSMTLPMGYSNNMPIGVNITANPFKEQVMFNLASAIEEITGIKDRRVK